MTASFTMSVGSRNCSADRNRAPSSIAAHCKQIPNPKSQIPNPKRELRKDWDLGFGFWDLGFIAMIARMIGPLITGLMTTFRHMFKPKVAVNYPYEKVPMFPKYRGKQVLMRGENGREKCVACGLCSVACPADAIYLEAAENDGTVMAGPRCASL